MDLGFDWFGCLKRFSRLSIINYYMCLFFLQEFGSYSAKDCLKFDWFNYNLHRLRFLRKRFAFCTLPVWRMVCVMFVRHSICSFKNIQGWSSHNQPFATTQDTASIVYIYTHHMLISVFFVPCLAVGMINVNPGLINPGWSIRGTPGANNLYSVIHPSDVDITS